MESGRRKKKKQTTPLPRFIRIPTFEDDVIHLKLVLDVVDAALRDLRDVAARVRDLGDGRVDPVDDHRVVVHGVVAGRRLEAKRRKRAGVGRNPEVGVLEVEVHSDPVEVGVDHAVVRHDHATI